jgi:hypothetical protein
VGSKKPLGKLVAHLAAVLLPCLVSPVAVQGLLGLACPMPGASHPSL